MSADTTIRVPLGLRERIRKAAAAHGLKQAELIDLALRELEQADFLLRVAAIEWDADARDEAEAWDAATAEEISDSWDPVR